MDANGRKKLRDDVHHGNYAERKDVLDLLDAFEQSQAMIGDLIGKLELSLQYLEHPDVQAMNFALGTDVVAKRIRKSIAKARGE